MDLLLDKRVLVIQGTGFNWSRPDHFRIVALLNKQDLSKAILDIGDFLSRYRQS